MSISRLSEGSITYCDEFEPDDDDLIRETGTRPEGSQPQRRHTSFVLGEHLLESSTPRIRLSHPQFFDKEKDSRDVQNKNQQRRSRALHTIQWENQSLNRNGEMSATSQKKTKGRKSSKRKTVSFELYRPGDGDTHEKSSHDLEPTPNEVQHEFQVPGTVGLPSPEYEPGTFFDPVKLETDSFCQMETINSVGSCEEQAQQLVEMFPNADPEFVRAQSKPMKAPLGDVMNPVLSPMENNEIPTREDIKKPQEADTKMKTFSVDQILKLVPDPWTYFSDKGRDCSGYSDHSLHYLKTKYRKFYNQTITDALLFHNQNLYLACKYLNKKNRGLKLRMTNRPMSECNACKPNTVNLQFLLEVAFIEQEEEVKNCVKAQNAAKKVRLKEAARLGLLAECECCYGDSLLREDVVTCTAGHTFCKECIARYIKTGIGNGIGQIQCLGPCNEEYTLQVIQDVLSPDMFTKLIETLGLPNIAELARCPFCNYVMFLPEDVTVVACLNLHCLKESCRICKGPNHEPMICEAGPNRRCWQCNEVVRREEGCNEMVCSCGGKTCHMCGQPVRDHSHFYLYEVEDGAKCPLYSNYYGA